MFAEQAGQMKNTHYVFGLHFALTISALLCLFSCSTIQVHSDEAVTPAPYTGTQHAMQATKRYWHQYDYYGQVIIAALDVPLCLIADTLVLPYDAYQSSRDSASAPHTGRVPSQ